MQHSAGPPSLTAMCSPRRSNLQALLTPAPAPIKVADGSHLCRVDPLPPPVTQCFRCLAYDHLVEDCRDPVHCRWCFRNGHRRSCYTMAGVFLCPLWPRSPARSSSLEESSSPRLDLTSSPAAWRAACTSSVVEQRRLQWLPAPLGPGIL